MRPAVRRQQQTKAAIDVFVALRNAGHGHDQAANYAATIDAGKYITADTVDQAKVAAAASEMMPATPAWDVSPQADTERWLTAVAMARASVIGDDDGAGVFATAPPASTEALALIVTQAALTGAMLHRLAPGQELDYLTSVRDSIVANGGTR